MQLHYAACPVWETGKPTPCTCPRPWLIRRDGQGHTHPWCVYRTTTDGYELFLRSSRYGQAVDLVRSLVSWEADVLR